MSKLTFRYVKDIPKRTSGVKASDDWDKLREGLKKRGGWAEIGRFSDPKQAHRLSQAARAKGFKASVRKVSPVRTAVYATLNGEVTKDN